MKTLHLSIIGVSGIGVLIIMLIFSTSNYITIKTDWSSYASSGTITASGEVNPVQPNEKVLIQVFYPDGELYNSAKVSLIDDSNFYEYQFNITSMRHGTYDFKIQVTYAGKTASTSFEYTENGFPGLQLLPSS